MTTSRTILVLGGTGKTGRRLADRLRAAGATVRTAARHGADVRFDWDDPATHDAALAGAEALYLVPPTLRLDYAASAGRLLDRAEAAGVGHVTFLSARGVENAPPESPMRAVELDLLGRTTVTRALVRPSWFMQNFSEGYFASSLLAEDAIDAPTGDGAEAFVHADDIAEVAAATLLDPAAHDGAAYALTGPEAITFAAIAERVSTVLGRPVVHRDLATPEWVAQTVAAGVPHDYAALLGMLLGLVRDGAGATLSDDVARVTGHAPRSFADYLADPATLAAWAAPAAAR